MHKYNNQNHSVLIAMLPVKNILRAIYDVWKVIITKKKFRIKPERNSLYRHQLNQEF